MTKEQFEAHVRAEAWDKYPVQGWTDPRDAELFDSLNRDQENRQAAYIASRMEHEWPLVEALQMILSEHPPHRDGMDNIPLPFGIKGGRAALSPYTTKPIEP